MKIGYAKIDTAISGDNIIVPAISGKKIQVISLTIQSHFKINVVFKSNTTALSGTMLLEEKTCWSTSIAAPSTNMTMNAVMQTASGEALVLNLDAEKYVGGFLTYRYVEDEI